MPCLFDCFNLCYRRWPSNGWTQCRCFSWSYHANVNFESRRWLRARVFPSVFLQLQMLSHPVFPRSKKFQNIHKTKIFPWSRLQVAKAGANMREKMRQNVLTMLRPLEKVSQQSGRWSCNIIIGRRQRIRMRRSTRPTRNLNKKTSMWSFPSWPGRCRRTERRKKRRWWTSLCLPSKERRRRRMPPSALRRGSGESR